jgi:hypothetical protein
LAGNEYGRQSLWAFFAHKSIAGFNQGQTKTGFGYFFI